MGRICLRRRLTNHTRTILSFFLNVRDTAGYDIIDANAEGTK
jgi:hypothetical protein